MPITPIASSQERLSFEGLVAALLVATTNPARGSEGGEPEQEGPAIEGDSHALREILLGVPSWAEPTRRRLLKIESARELAVLIVLNLSLAQLSNQKDVLANAGAGLSGDALDRAYAAVEAALPYQRLLRKPDGSFDCHKDGAKVPKAQQDPLKLSQRFATVADALARAPALDWESPATLRALNEGLSTRATHQTRLSAPQGNGGFLKTKRCYGPGNLTDNPASVSEEDFLTTDGQSVAGDAAQHKYAMLSLALVEFQGQELRVPDALRLLPDLARQVTDVLAQAGAPQAAVLLDALAAPVPIRFSGEAQVFCGQGDDTRALSVLTPYALPREIGRAKQALRAAHLVDWELAFEVLGTELTALEAVMAELKAAPPAKGKEAKQLASDAKEAAGDAVAAKKQEIAAALKAKYLVLPTFLLPVGGAIPRNVAFGLGLELHRATMFSKIYRPRPTHDLSRKVFYGNSLVQTPFLAAGKLPRALRATSQNAAEKRWRKDLFADLVMQCLGQLTELQRLYLRGPADHAQTLSSDANDQLVATNAAWSLFIKGDASVSRDDAAALLEPLVFDVRNSVKEALGGAYGKPFTNEFDDELLALVTRLVALERA